MVSMAPCAAGRGLKWRSGLAGRRHSSVSENYANQAPSRPAQVAMLGPAAGPSMIGGRTIRSGPPMPGGGTMNSNDQEPIITIALMAAMADGSRTPDEQSAIAAVARQAGLTNLDALTRQIGDGSLRLADVAGRLSDDTARRLAYETAVVVVNADGAAGDRERRFLADLQAALGLSAAAVAGVNQGAGALAA